MMKRRARFFDVRLRVGALSSLEERRKRKQKLSDRKEEKCGSPECARKDF
jgi:hypothetical protein